MEIWIWVGFIAVVIGLIILDLGVIHRGDKVIGTRSALFWTGFYVVVSLLFNVAVYFLYENHWLGIGEQVGADLDGRQAALEFFAAYLIEKSLSLDNIFVIALIFSHFRVPAQYQHRVLLWGILGAIIMRGIMIAAGVVMIRRFDWIVYFFGALLLFTAIRLLFTRREGIEPEENMLVRLTRRVFPVTSGYEGHHFFSRIDGARAVTPLFLVLLVVESTDLLFAVDSIPAVFAVTHDAFIVFTSNIFAILGLRTLYFALAGLMDRFRFLKISLVVLLAFVGVKMILSHHVEIPILASLAIIAGILAAGIIASMIAARTKFRQPLEEGEKIEGAGSVGTRPTGTAEVIDEAG